MVQAFFAWLFRLLGRRAGRQASPINPPAPPAVIVPLEPSQPSQAPLDVVPVPAKPVPVPPKPPAKPPVVQSHYWRGTYAVTQRYGCTDFATEGHNPNHPECAYFHEGIDFGLPCGTPLYSGGTLTVISIDAPGWGGASLQLRGTAHDVWLMHMHDYAVKVGERVVPGQLLGHSGTRGNSTGCHVHFMVIPIGKGYRQSVNPIPFL